MIENLRCAGAEIVFSKVVRLDNNKSKSDFQISPAAGPLHFDRSRWRFLTRVNRMLHSAATQAAEKLTFRRAERSDAQELAELFDRTYGQTSHPLRDREQVLQLVAQEENYCWLSLFDDRIVSCVGITHFPWNDSFELGRAITIPEFQGQGLALRLIESSVEWLCNTIKAELIWGTPRVRRIYEICCKDISPGMIATGHDGGANFAQGQRETHLIIFGSALASPKTHVRPCNLSKDLCDFIEQRYWQPLGWNSPNAAYPATILSGPVKSGAQSQGHLIYQFDENCPSRALEILEYTLATSDPAQFVFELSELAERCHQAAHISLSLLVDKSDYLRQLVHAGFSVTAYLPGWHRENGHRYDCLRLVRRMTREPCTGNGMESLFAMLDDEFDHWFANSKKSR